MILQASKLDACPILKFEFASVVVKFSLERF